MILVTGGTGNIGSELVRLLIAAGQKIRVLVRTPAKVQALEGKVEVAIGDLDKPETLAPALKGVERAFLLAGGPNVPAQETAFIRAAKAAGLKHVVMVSSGGVGKGLGSGPAHEPGEAELKASGLAWTLLHPWEFMSNLMWARQTIVEQGAIYSPTGQGRSCVIHPHDIAAVAAKVLTSEGHAGKTYELTGPEALTTAEMAARLSAAAGRPIQHVDIPDAAYREALAKAGLPPPVVDPMAKFYAAVKAGGAAGTLPTVQQLTGTPARTFDVWAKENAAAFR
jgi:uncharacterized protein YbjT (DUF2867 family)